jgi:hypothetical protein
MFRSAIISLSGLLLASCGALKDVNLLPDTFDAFQKKIDVAPAFFVTVAADYEKTSKELLNLTGRTCDGLATKAIVRFRGIPLTVIEKGKKRTLTYSEYEKGRFEIKSRALTFLTQYAAEMKRRAEESENLTKGLGYATTGATIVEQIPVVGAQATVYTTAAKAIISILDLSQNNYTAEEISRVAARTETHLEKIIIQVNKDFGIISDDAAIFLDAWADCRRAKVQAIKGPLPGLAPTSPYELDAAYSAFLQQAIDYKKSVPTVEEELAAIITANKKIAKGDFGAVLTGAQELINAANAAYNAVKAVPGTSI